MILEQPLVDYTTIVQEFREARQKADLEMLMARLRGKSAELLSYEDVRLKLRAIESNRQVLQDIPLDAIVGSVGRYADFTRSFFPLQDSDEARWASVRMGAESLVGLPPIEVYRLGDAYFVKDGNHRVSVARQSGMTLIQAYVTEVKCRAPLTPEVRPDDLILKSEYLDFLAYTQFDQLAPEADLTVTAPGKYAELCEHISVHRYYLGVEQQREIPMAEAVLHWYESVYMPVISIVRCLGLLYEFPQRTETDLYLWLLEHRAALEQQLGWDVQPEDAATDLVSRCSPTLAHWGARLGGKLLNVLPLEDFASGPAPGVWREARTAACRHEDRLFRNILVAFNGAESGWCTLQQAFEIAWREGSQINGLHVVATAEQENSAATQALRAEFERRCAEAHVAGRLTVEVGGVAQRLSARAHWVDLVMFSLEHPPGHGPLAKLQSGARALIQRTSRPLLALPCCAIPLKCALLAYDGSPMSREALFVAAYLARRRPEMTLHVLAVQDGGVGPDTVAQATAYLEQHGVGATYHLRQESGGVAQTILATAEEVGSTVLVMGSYGYGAVLEVLLGSTLDQVLRASCLPILICR